MPALDGLRGVAILLVVLVHCSLGWLGALSVFRDVGDVPPTFAMPGWVRAICDGGGAGVALFFVVSAFTLTIQAFRRKNDSLFGYAVRRIARVAPGFWLAAIAYGLLTGFGPRPWAPHGIDGASFVRGVLFLSAWWADASLAVVPGGWSVSCEIAFYAALPVCLALVGGRLWRAVAITLAALAAAQLRARHDIIGGDWGFLQSVSPVQQAPVFLLGVTAALAVLRLPVPRLPFAALACLGIAIAVVPLSGISERRLLHYLAFSLAAAATVAISAVRPPRLLRNALLRRIGEVSYSMYLVHFAVLRPSLYAAEQLLPADNTLTMTVHLAITVATTFLIAQLTFRFVEKPGIALGARLARTRAGLPG